MGSNQVVESVRIETWIACRPERAFDLARDVDFHPETAGATAEKVVRTPRRFVELNDEVTFQARHLGITWQLTSRIVNYARPEVFTDRMTRGPFRFFEHRHEFHAKDGGTLMIDRLEFEAPLGVLGRIADRLVLQSHMTAFLGTRAQAIKQAAEVAL